ncbi:MAG: helix-turn-helix transcriptional regulator [Bacteroidales bacterium]|nr:helix-turn-helix transcriptional regulator [Bacteroidales bacterium]
MIDRIKTILDKFGMTASEFADRIEVRRPNVSHVLSGRNKPSLDFASRILASFPEIDTEWLITGTGNMMKNIQADDGNPGKEEYSPPPPKEKNGNVPYPFITGKKKPSAGVKKIIFIYEDDTFEEFRPR